MRWPEPRHRAGVAGSSGDNVTEVPVLSECDAHAVAMEFASDAVTRCSGDIVAVVLIGSLAVGDYVPGRSDIDTAVILDDSASDRTTGVLRDLGGDLHRRHSIPKGFGVEITNHRQLGKPLDPCEELAPVILDITQRGRVIAGALDLGAIRTPDEADLRAYCRHFIPWLRADRRRQQRRTVVESPDTGVNGLLYELRLGVLSLTGHYVLRKREIIPALLASHPGVTERHDLQHLQAYLRGTSPPPERAWVDTLRDRVERYTSRIAPWAFTRRPDCRCFLEDDPERQ
jgi:hypothetical protein